MTSDSKKFYKTQKAGTDADSKFIRSHVRQRKCESCTCRYNLYPCKLPCTEQPSIDRSKRIKLNESENLGNFISQRENINEMDKYGRTILHTAVAQCDFPLVEKLIKQGADPFVRTKANLSILWFAVKAGCIHTAEVLAEYGCIDDKNLSSYLFDAIMDKRYYMIKFLIHNGADVNEPMSHYKQMVPLHLVSLQTNKEFVKLFMDHGAYVDAVDDDNETALFKVTRIGSSNLISVLLQYGANVHHRNNKGMIVLHLAVKLKFYRPKTLKCLVKQGGADVNAEMTHSKETPLHLAAQETCSEICHEGVTIIFRRWQYEFYNVLDYNPHTSNIFALEQLLIYEAKVNVKNIKKQTPLHFAVTSGCPYLVQQLLDAGADVDVVDECGNFPLKIAVEQGIPCIVRQLLVAGADPKLFFAIDDYASLLTPEVERAFAEFFIARRAAGLIVEEIKHKKRRHFRFFEQ